MVKQVSENVNKLYSKRMELIKTINKNRIDHLNLKTQISEVEIDLLKLGLSVGPDVGACW